MTELIGQTIGNYRIEALLGVGGMGQVFRARHVHLDRLAAIKVMHANLAADPGFQARFHQEAKVIAALEHPNIVKVLDFGEQAGRFYLVLELLTDGSLRALLQRHTRANQPWSLPLGLDLVRQAADALAYAHGQNMIHRDIKPDNMLLKRVTMAGQTPDRYLLKLTDFGLARLAEGSVMTATGTVMGTPAYMSPEQCQGIDQDGRSDIYALGVVLYEVTTGYLPFTVKTMSEAVYKHINVAPPPPRQVRPDLPVEIEAIILRCLAKQPDERFATAADLSSALQEALGNPALATISSVVPTLPPPDGTVVQPATSNTTPPIVHSLPGTSPVPRVQVRDQQGQTLQIIDLARGGLTVGRVSDNNVVLPAEAVSRNHLRVDWDGSRVTVTDLGSSNGTLLADTRLVAQVAQPWAWGDLLHVGPYWLRLEQPVAPTELTIQSPLTGAQSPTTGAAPDLLSQLLTSAGRIGVVVEPETLTITPGQSAVVKVTLANLGSIVDQLTLTVEGVPEAWARGPAQAVQLNPGARATIPLNIGVPRAPASRAGEYPVKIRAGSRAKPAESGVAPARWTVLPFALSNLAITPKKASGQQQAAYTVGLRNDGNASAHYTLSGSDDEQTLSYAFARAGVPLDGMRTGVSLEPGESADMALRVGAPRRWIGNAQPRNFTVRSGSVGGDAPQTAIAQFVQRALIPWWVPLVVVVLLALSFGLYDRIVKPPDFVGEPSFTPSDPQPGRLVVVHWRVNNAQSITLHPEGLPEIGPLNPSTGVYTFTNGFPRQAKVTIVATSRFGLVATKNLEIAIIAPTPTPTPEPGAPVIKLFSINDDSVGPIQVELDKPVTIAWEVTGAESVTIEQFGTVDPTGQRQDTPQETTSYKLTAIGKGGTQNPVRIVKVIVINTAATVQVLDSQTAQVAAQQTAQAAATQAAQDATQAARPSDTPTPAPITPVPSGIDNFIGTWVNTDNRPKTDDLTLLIIEKVNANTANFHAYTECTPGGSRDLGTVHARLEGSKLIGEAYDLGAVQKTITLTLLGQELRADVKTDPLLFNLPDRDATYTLKKSTALEVSPLGCQGQVVAP